MFIGCITMGHGWGISNITKKYLKEGKLDLNVYKTKCKNKEASHQKNSSIQFKNRLLATSKISLKSEDLNKIIQFKI